MHKKICEYCKKEFVTRNKQQRFCCQKCHGKSRMTVATNPETKRLYNVWKLMNKRCDDKQNKLYGGRGIQVCDEWKNSFDTFYDWAINNGYDKNAPRGKCTIDRINNNGNYEPENCRWVDFIIQNNNKRTNHIITVNGYTDTIANCCRKFNVSKDVILDRLKLGWSVEKAFNWELKKKYNLLIYKNEIHSIKQWSKLSNIPYHTLLYRIKQNWDIHDIFEIPYQFDRIKIQYRDSYMSIKELAKKFNSTSLQIYKEVFNENNH